MELKFKVIVRPAQEIFEDADADMFATVVQNRKGRQWAAKALWGCPGNAAENAMVLQEMLNDGVKLEKDSWTEI